MATGYPAASLADIDARLTSAASPFATKDMVIAGRPVKVFVNAPDSLRDFWLATKAYGDKDYIVFEDTRYTYAQAHVKTVELANMLLSYGARKGDRVGIVMRNYPEWILLFFAIQSIGAIATCINAFSPAGVLEYCITSTNCKVIAVDSERANLLLPLLSKLRAGGCNTVLVVRSDKVPTGMIDYTTALSRFAGSTTLPKIDILPEDNAVIFFTSGTTGLPKGVLSTQRQYLTNPMNAIFGGARALLRRGEAIPAPDPTLPQKGALLAIPLFHVTGNQSTLGPVTALGGKIVLMYKWEIATAVRLLRDEKLTTAGGVPFVVTDLISAGVKPEDLVLETISFGGGPGSSKIPAQMASKFPAVQPGQGYGLTETNAIVSAFSGEDYAWKPTSCGIISPVTRCKIVDVDSGKSLPFGSVGEIVVAGANVAQGYWNNEKATKESFSSDGWFRTGDIGRIDEEGFLFISDRLKDVIIKNGENISTITVEDALYKDDRIKDVCVVGVPDEKFGETVAAVVVVRPSVTGPHPTEASLQKLVAGLLPKHAIPSLIVVQTEELVRNANGKTVKMEIKKTLVELAAKRTKAKL